MEQRGGGSILTLTYLGSERVFPNYNVMGVAKAALEATVRYLAADLGPKNIRVNAISAGPIKTLAASGISGFSSILQVYRDRAPLRRTVETAEVADAAMFLLGPAGRGVTAEVLMVDAGYPRHGHVACCLATHSRWRQFDEDTQVSSPVILLLVTLLAPLLLTACGKTVGETIDDATITTRVKTSLLNDPDVGGLRIDVDTFKGVVTLSGRVKTKDERSQGAGPGAQDRRRDRREVHAADTALRVRGSKVRGFSGSS